MNPEMKKRLCAALGLPETTPDEEIMSKCEAKCRAKAEDPAKLEASIASAVKEQVELVAKPMREALEAEKAKTVELQASLAKAAAEKFDADATKLCEELVTAGQILPVHREKVIAFAKKVGLVEAREVYGALPKAPPAQGEKGLDPSTKPNTDAAVLKAAYETELDARVKAGEPVTIASRELRKDAKYRALFLDNVRSLRSGERETA